MNFSFPTIILLKFSVIRVILVYRNSVWRVLVQSLRSMRMTASDTLQQLSEKEGFFVPEVAMETETKKEQ